MTSIRWSNILVSACGCSISAPVLRWYTFVGKSLRENDRLRCESIRRSCFKNRICREFFIGLAFLWFEHELHQLYLPPVAPVAFWLIGIVISNLDRLCSRPPSVQKPVIAAIVAISSPTYRSTLEYIPKCWWLIDIGSLSPLDRLKRCRTKVQDEGGPWYRQILNHNIKISPWCKLTPEVEAPWC